MSAHRLCLFCLSAHRLCLFCLSAHPFGSVCLLAQRLFTPVKPPINSAGRPNGSQKPKHLKTSRLRTFATGSPVKNSMHSCLAGTQHEYILVSEPLYCSLPADVNSPSLREVLVFLTCYKTLNISSIYTLFFSIRTNFIRTPRLARLRFAQKLRTS